MWHKIFSQKLAPAGGPGSACNNHTPYHFDGAEYCFRDWLYFYGWHVITPAANTPTHPLAFCAADSDFRPAEIIRALAVGAKSERSFVSRRIGAGTWKPNLYTFPSYARRDSFITPHFILGSMSFLPGGDKTYAKTSGECRFMGLWVNHEVNDRIIVSGVGTAKKGKADYFGLNGFSYKRVLIACRDRGAQDNRGVQIFMGAGSLTRGRFEKAGWTFSSAGQTGVAFRAADGGYSAQTNEKGILFTLENPASPFILEVAPGDDPSSMNHFVGRMQSQAPSFAQGKLSYRSLAGDLYEVDTQGNSPGSLNGVPIDLNPGALYESPTLHSEYGKSVVTISYPGFKDLVLNFDYSQK